MYRSHAATDQVIAFPMEQKPPTAPRSPINLRIKFRSDSVEQFIERYAVDVSRGGIFIRTKEPLSVGTQLRLDFQFQNGGALMAGDGTVVWIRQFDPNRLSVPPGMGVRFDKLTPESQSVLEQLLAEKAKRERGAVPGSGAGGLAVRRPSSMFSALEPQVMVSERPQGDKPDQSAPSQPGSPASSALEDSGKPEALAHRPAVGPAGALPGAGAASLAKPAVARVSQRHTPAGGAATFDDMNDEPTQIAGKLPSFLSTDDEPTRAVSIDRGSVTDSGKAAHKDAPIPAETRKQDDSLDSIFPVTSSTAPPPAIGASPPPSAEPRESDARATTTDPHAPASSAKGEPPAAGVEPASATPATSGAPSDTAARPKTTTAQPHRPAKRRSPAVLVAVSVIVLGAAAIFISRFFGSQATETISPASSPSGTTSISPAPGRSPAPAVPTPAAGIAPPSAAAEIPPPPAPGAAPPPSIAASTDEPHNNMPATAPTKSDSATHAPRNDEQPNNSDSAASHKASKHKPARAAREPGAVEAPAQEAKPVEAPPAAAAPTPTAPEGQGSSTTTPPAGDADIDAHQIRITSRPSGADVSLDGQSVGKTPFSVGIADVAAPHFVSVRKDGFEPFEQMISASSDWSKTKAPKGKPVVQVLKINAKLKQLAGTEAKPETGPAAATGDGAPKTDLVKPERPSPPAGERAPATSPP
jgi:uncharacterized protein (TIGR02266 family)